MSTGHVLWGPEGSLDSGCRAKGLTLLCSLGCCPDSDREEGRPPGSSMCGKGGPGGFLEGAGRAVLLALCPQQDLAINRWVGAAVWTADPPWWTFLPAWPPAVFPGTGTCVCSLTERWHQLREPDSSSTGPGTWTGWGQPALGALRPPPRARAPGAGGTAHTPPSSGTEPGEATSDQAGKPSPRRGRAQTKSTQPSAGPSGDQGCLVPHGPASEEDSRGGKSEHFIRFKFEGVTCRGS